MRVGCFESSILTGIAGQDDLIHFVFQRGGLPISQIAHIQSIHDRSGPGERDDGNAVAKAAVPLFVIGRIIVVVILVLVVVVDHVDEGLDGGFQRIDPLPLTIVDEDSGVKSGGVTCNSGGPGGAGYGAIGIEVVLGATIFVVQVIFRIVTGSRGFRPDLFPVGRIVLCTRGQIIEVALVLVDIFIIERFGFTGTIGRVDVVEHIIDIQEIVLVGTSVTAHGTRDVQHKHDVRRNGSLDKGGVTRCEGFQLDPVGAVRLRRGDVLTVAKAGAVIDMDAVVLGPLEGRAILGILDCSVDGVLTLGAGHRRESVQHRGGENDAI